MRTETEELKRLLDFKSIENELLVSENDNFKTEVERLKGIILAQSSDFVRSKTVDDGIKPEGHNDLAGRAIERCLELQAKVERLRKAGDAMRDKYLELYWSVRAGSSQLQNPISVEAWEQAKEGKQS